MQHINLNDDFRNKLLESAAWGKIGLNVNEGKAEKGQQSLKEAVDAQGYEQIQDSEEQEVVEEGETHVCPLCTSLLPEAIDEERVLEHLHIIANVLDRLSSINESEEDLESIIAECVNEVLLESEEMLDEDSEEDSDDEISDDEYDEEESDDVVEEGDMGGYGSSTPAGKKAKMSKKPAKGKMKMPMKGKKSC
jgi:hypothetical protein